VQKRALAITSFAVLGALVLFDVLPWRCPVAWLAHVPCPTCGLTRATRLAFGGDLGASVRTFPAGPFTMLALVPTVIAEIVMFVRTGAFRVYRGRKTLHALVIAASVVVFVVWIARFFGMLGGPVAV
jgi:hypothetical protein